MKDCKGNYVPWGFEQEYLNSEPIVIPNPICAGCEYIQACVFRVNYFLEYGKDMHEEDVEIIKRFTAGSQIIQEPLHLGKKTLN